MGTGIATASDTAASSARLGAHLRSLRRARGQTLVQLAAAAELSHPFLSQLERGLAQPSLGTLRRLAIALDTSPIELVAASEPPPTPAPRQPELVRAGDRGGPVSDFAEGEARMLVHGDRPFRPLVLNAANAEPGRFYRHAEDEFVHVIEGVVVADVDGARFELASGDSLYYAGGSDHRWWSADGGGYRLFVVKERPPLGTTDR